MDIEVIKKKREELMKKKGGGSNDLWKPSSGENHIRIVPYQYDKDNPFTEIHWHYNINGKHILCPRRNFGEECPICDVARELWQEENEEDKQMAKKLFATMQFYAPIIVRGQEQQGVKFWRFSQTIYDNLLLPFENGEIDDFTDIENGRDVVVTRKSPKEVGNMYGKTSARLSMNSSPMLSEDIISDELMTKILEEQKDIFDVLENSRYEVEEINKLLKDWFDEEANEDSKTDEDDKDTDLDDISEEESENEADDVMEKFKNILDEDTDDE